MVPTIMQSFAEFKLHEAFLFSLSAILILVIMDKVVLPLSRSLSKYISLKFMHLLYYRRGLLAPYFVIKRTQTVIRYLVIFISTIVLAYHFLYLYIPNKIVSPSGRTSIILKDGEIIVDNFQPAAIVNFDVDLELLRQEESQYFYQFEYVLKFRANTNEKASIDDAVFKYTYNNGKELYRRANRNMLKSQIMSENKNSKYHNKFEFTTTQPILTATAKAEVKLKNMNGNVQSIFSDKIVITDFKQ